MNHLAVLHEHYVFFFGVLLRGYIVVIAGMLALLAMWPALPWQMRLIFAVAAVMGYYPVAMAWLTIG